MIILYQYSYITDMIPISYSFYANWNTYLQILSMPNFWSIESKIIYLHFLICVIVDSNSQFPLSEIWSNCWTERKMHVAITVYTFWQCATYLEILYRLYEFLTRSLELWITSIKKNKLNFDFRFGIRNNWSRLPNQNKQNNLWCGSKKRIRIIRLRLY